MNITEMEQAVDSAKAELRRADTVATSLAYLLVGRLRHVKGACPLAALKKELRNFNIHTGMWKDE